MRPLKLFRRADERPPLKDRLAALKARLGRITRKPDGGTDTHRRVMLTGAVAAAVPLPAFATAVARGPHPDAELLAAGERYERAIAAEASAETVYQRAWKPVRTVLETCPAALIPTQADWRILRRGRWPTAVGGCLQHLPPIDGCVSQAWTGEVLRNAIRQAVPKLGKGGQTPHQIRRWKGLLPVADAFDAQVSAAECTTNYERKSRERMAACGELRDAMRAVRSFEATTPEGLAVLTRICALDHERGYDISPNLLRSAANVAGIDLSQVARPRPNFF